MEVGEQGKASGRRALLIAYYWPPAGGPGVQRWLKFCKYLPANGWNLTALVPEGAAYPVLDASLGADVPRDMEVIGVPIFEPYEAAMSLFKGKDAERLGSGGNTEGLAGKAMRWVRGNVLLPDPRVLWRRRAIREGLNAVRKAERENRPYDAIITTGPPHSVHLIGLGLKRRTGLPWLADFRDLWREMDYLEDFLPTQRTRNRHRTMEAEVVRAADTVTITSPSVRQSLAIHLPEGHPDKFKLVYNGWDEADVDDQGTLPASPTPRNGNVFHLGHFGSLFPTRNAPGLWKAIRQWNAEGSHRPYHLDVVGNINAEVRESIGQLLTPEDWTDHGYLSHGEAVRMMQEMDGLLLIQNDSTTGQRAIPGKAFEYLATGKPIATVTPHPSDLHDLVASWNLTSCRHDDATAAMEMLRALHQDAGTDPGLARRFSRSTLSHGMAEILNHISSTPSH